MIRIEPYKRWSGGAKALGNRCGILRATPRQVNKHGDFSYIINWGATERRFKGTYINDPARVVDACDKMLSFKRFTECGVPSPAYTSERTEAQEWLDAGESVVARRLLRANSGRGIVFCSPGDGERVPSAPLYTKYSKKVDEYRVHVFSGQVIDVQHKRKRQEVDNDDVDYQIRNAANGWVYCRGGVSAPDSVSSASIRAVDALALDFGAVDVGFNGHTKEASVYEVNTAPGLEGQTLDSYYNAFLAKFPQLQRGRYRLRRSV